MRVIESITMIRGEGFVMVQPKNKVFFVPCVWDIFQFIGGETRNAYPIGGRNVRRDRNLDLGAY